MIYLLPTHESLPITIVSFLFKKKKKRGLLLLDVNYHSLVVV